MATSRSRARRAPAAHARRSGGGGGGFSAQAPSVIGAIVLIIVFAVWMTSGDDKPKQVEKPVERGPDIGWNHPTVRATATWLGMVADDNRVDLAISTDLDAFQRRFKMTDQRPVSSLNGDERSVLKDAILERLTKSDETKLLRDFEPYTGKLAEVAMHTQPSGRAVLEIQARPAVRDQFLSDATVEVSFLTRDGRIVVDGFQVISLPREKPKPVVKSTASHEVIAKPEKKVIERDGKKFSVWEAEPVPLPHLADTPEPIRVEIDQLVGELIRMDSEMRPRDRTRVKRRLTEIGKPAVPRLLTKFCELKADTPLGVSQLTQIDALLRDLSGQAFGFTPAQQTVLSSTQENEDARVSALGQWYGWWYYFHDKPLDAAFDKEEDLFDTPPSKKK